MSNKLQGDESKMLLLLLLISQNVNKRIFVVETGGFRLHGRLIAHEGALTGG